MTRALAEGVRVFAISIVISIVLGHRRDSPPSLLIVALTLFYTFEGGMTAVIWTDVVQMALYVVGAILSFFVILHKIPGGWAHVVAVAAPRGQIPDLRFRLQLSTCEFFSRTYTFWAGLVGGCFLTTASHGTDQLMVQRLLSARNEAQSRAALLASWVVIFFQFTLFLLIGVALFVYYREAGLPAPARLDRIYPQFIWQHLPPGIAGLVIAAIIAAAMANLSAALNSLASTTVMDFFRPSRPRRSRGARQALAAAGAGMPPWPGGWSWWPLASWRATGDRCWSPASPSRPSPWDCCWACSCSACSRGASGQNAAIVGVLTGLAVILYVRFMTPIAWTWWVLIGTLAYIRRRILCIIIAALAAQPADASHRQTRTQSAGSGVELRRDLGLWGAVAIVVGTVIGSGIFLVPQTMVQLVGTPRLVFVVWMVGGLLSLAGALSYAELAAAMPEAGGEYVYLREAYGPLWGFIYGWTQMWVAKSGSIATLATGFFTIWPISNRSSNGLS